MAEISSPPVSVDTSEISRVGSSEPIISIDSLLTSPSEIDYPLEEHDLKLVAEFDKKWCDFLKRNPSMIPRGQKMQRVKQMQQEVRESLQHQKAVESELQGQLEFFQNAFEKLEATSQKEMNASKEHQTLLRDFFQKHLDNVAVSAQVMNGTISWVKFLESLDEPVAEESSSSSASSAKSVKPSSRAMKLIEPSGDADDDDFRAYQMDNALLKTQIKVLEKELERYEKMEDTMKVVGSFLTEHNVWGLLTNNSQM